MAGPVYATEEDYETSPYGGSPVPADVDSRLAVASRVVDEMAMSAVYSVNEDEEPTHPATIEAFRDATIAQARYSQSRGDDDGTGDSWNSVGIGSANISRSSGGSAGQTTGGLSPRYSPLAYSILQQAGLVPGTIFTPGSLSPW